MYRLRTSDFMAAAVIFAGLVLLALTPPARAADVSSSAPPPAAEACAYTLDAVVSQLSTNPAIIQFSVLDKPELVKAITDALTLAGETIPEGVTRILVAQVRTTDGTVHVRYGLEVAGCLSVAKEYPLASPFPAAEHLSGGTALGVFA